MIDCTRLDRAIATPKGIPITIHITDGISHKVGKELKLKGRYETLENGAVKVYAELG